MSNGKRLFLSIALVLCIALVIAAAFLVGDYIEGARSDRDQPDDSSHSQVVTPIYINDELYLPRKEVRNYLIMGIDESGDIGSEAVGQVDFLLILSFNSETKEYTMVSVNRDTMVETREVDMLGNKRDVLKQIALSHSGVGGEGLTNKEKCENTMASVSNIFQGMKFDGYMSMTMNAVDILVDDLGGVDVYVEDDYTSMDERLVAGTTVTMDGELAMKFVRMRGGLEDSSNIARMRRQESFLKAFFSKMGESQMSDDALLESYSDVEKYVYCSAGANGYEELFWKLQKYEEGESISLNGEAIVGKGGYMEFYVDESHVTEVIVDVFYEKARS